MDNEKKLMAANDFTCGAFTEKTPDHISQLPHKGDTVVGNDVWFGRESFGAPSATASKERLHAFQCFNVGRKPLYRVKLLPRKPGRILVLQKRKLPRNNAAQKTFHHQMKLRIVVLNRAKPPFHANLRCKLLADFPRNRIFRAFAFLNLSARKFPPVLPLAILN